MAHRRERLDAGGRCKVLNSLIQSLVIRFRVVLEAESADIPLFQAPDQHLAGLPLQHQQPRAEPPEARVQVGQALEQEPDPVHAGPGRAGGGGGPVRLHVARVDHEDRVEGPARPRGRVLERGVVVDPEAFPEPHQRRRRRRRCRCRRRHCRGRARSFGKLEWAWWRFAPSRWGVELSNVTMLTCARVGSNEMIDGWMAYVPTWALEDQVEEG